MALFRFREALPSDEDAILELARHLNTLNLPPEREFIHDLLQASMHSFAGGVDPHVFDEARKFLFVLESPDGRVVGTSMIHAQHGTRHEPHVFFQVAEQERYAELTIRDSTRQVHMVHTVLTMGQTYRGPTEVGGLVLHPEVRGHPDKLGRLLSLGRFVYIAAKRPWFRERVLAELLPPLDRGDGGTRSPLWDALGHRFTGLTYDEADALSRDDKEFIWKLFPMNPINASLLPRTVQDILGKVGDASKGAARMLESIGFSWSGRIDPFDGGPHFEAATDDVTLVRDTRPLEVELAEEQLEIEHTDASSSMVAAKSRVLPGIVGRLRATAPHFVAVWTPIEAVPHPFEDRDRVRLNRAALLALQAFEGDDGPTSAHDAATSNGQELPPDLRVLVALRPKRRRSDRLGG
jgi:arginine N-succinyltransferase